MYDTASRLSGVTDSTAMGTDFQFTYDARGQLQNERQYHELMGKNVLFDRDYDAVGNRTWLETNIGGSISGSSIVGGVWDMYNHYTYDAMNRLTYLTQSSRTGANAVAPKQAKFAYSAASELTDMRRYSDTAGSSAALEVHSRLGYDLAGRLTSITHGKTDIAAGETWNGTSTAPASLGASNLLAGYFLTYDQDNRVTSLSSWRDAAKTSYSYNTTDQLTGATSTQIAGLTLPFALPVAETYNLDLNGNRKGSGGASQSASGTHNRLQTDGTYNYTYDNEGNTTRRTKIVGGQVTDYTWDHRNRLASVTDRVSASGVKTQQVEYVYDAFNQLNGKRVATQFDSSGNVTNWSRYEVIVWADGQEVFRFVDSDGQGSQPARIANRYLWGDAVDQLLADEQYAVGSGPAVTATTAGPTPGNTLWALTDHLGSVRDLVDNNGVIREHNVYDSFGRLVREVDYNAAGQVISSLDPAAVDTVFGYTGRLFDPHTGLQYNRARWYDANTGRWVSQDPIGFAAGDANLYRYVGNGPTDATDPSGLQDSGVIPLQPPTGGWPSRHPTPNIGGRPLTPDEILQQFRNSPGSPSSYIGPYSKPFWMSYNEYSLAYIAANREGIHMQISSQLFWMLMRNPPNLPPEMAGCNATPMELYEASQVLANLYIDAVVEFLRTHHGAKPAQGSRNFILDYYGFSNEYNHPWCDDWATFISDYLWQAMQENTITVGGEECSVGNFFKIDRYYWASGGHEHNYVGVRPWGYLLSSPVTNDPVLLIFDPWWHLWPEVFTTETEPLPPSGQGIRPMR